jgi:GNAT superfamily N-acetyltransferase
VIIRRATRADEPGIQNVIRTCYELLDWGWFPDDYHKDLYEIDSHYHDKGNEFYVAEQNGEIVGTAAVDFFPKLPGEVGTVQVDGFVRICGSDCSLERLYVLPSARRQGIGIALWQKTIDRAKAKGCRRMEIWSDKLLHEAHAMYENKGATRMGDRLCHDPSQSPEWGMAFDI